MQDPSRDSRSMTPHQLPGQPASPLWSLLRAVREVLETMIPAVIIALLINLLLAQATRVYGQSM